MKKIILMVLALAITVGVAQATAAPKAKKEKNKTQTIEFVTNIDCEHCVKKVMDFMPSQKGVREVKVDLPTKKIAVTYLVAKSSKEALIKLFAKIDVDAKVAPKKCEDEGCCK